MKTGECFSQQCFPPDLAEGGVLRLIREVFLNGQIGVNTGANIVALSPSISNILCPW